MADSLQQQLVRAGLAEPDQAQKRKPGGDKGRKGKGAPKGKGKGKSKAQSQSAARPDEQKPADKQQRPSGRTRTPSARERTAQLRGLVAKHRLPRQEARTPYRFTLGRRIKEITVTETQQGQLARGEAGIVNVQGRFEVLPAAAIESVRELEPDAVVVRNTGDTPSSAAEAEANHERPVPDDLIW